MEKPKVIVICGPTASGKTALSIELAKKINGEIVSADSMQIYKDMNIGSAKVTNEEMQGIKHYMIDCVSPDERFSVADYKTNAKNAIEEIIKKGKTPIVVGGTGLYIDALIYEIEYKDIKIDENYRKELQEIEKNQGLEVLYKKALEINPEDWESTYFLSLAQMQTKDYENGIPTKVSDYLSKNQEAYIKSMQAVRKEYGMNIIDDDLNTNYTNYIQNSLLKIQENKKNSSSSN